MEELAARYSVNGRFRPVAIAAVYFLVIMLIYYYRVVPAFSYMGYGWNQPYRGFVFVMALFAIFPSVFMQVNLARPSIMANWILYMFVYMPSVSISILVTNRSWQAGLLLQFVLLSGMMLQLLVSRFRLVRFRRSIITWPRYSKILGGAALASLVVIVFLVGVHFNLMVFVDEYIIRDSFNTRINAYPLLAYLISWLSDVINPLWLLVSLFRGNRGSASIACMGQAFIFAQSGHKTVLFSVLMILVLYFFSSRFKGKLVLYFVLAITFLMVFSWGIDLLTDSYFATSIFARRGVHTPGLLTGYYWDYFSDHSILFYSHSFMKSFIKYPYAMAPPFVIGYQYFESVEMAANVNYLADGFSNLGYFGIIVHAGILAMYLYIYDSVSQDMNVDFAALILIVPVLGLVNSALFTCLLTGGLGLLVFLVAMMPAAKSSIFTHGPL